MKCPVCGIALTMTERQGVDIDFCPQCRGVWLDRGELDKIIERSASFPEGERGGERGRDVEEREPNRKKRKGKGGFLGDLFDFG